MSPTIPRSFSRETGWLISSKRFRLAGHPDRAASLARLAAPSWFEPRVRGRVSPLLPLYSPLYLPLSRVSGDFTGECGGTSTGYTPSPVAGPARVRARQGAGNAGPLRRLRLLAKRAAGRGFWANSPAWPGSARPRPGVSPLAPRPPLNAADLGHSPRYAIPACARGRSRDQPPERLCLRPPSRRCTRLASKGWSRLTPVCRDSAAAQPVWRRWGSASRRLCRCTGTAPAADPLGLIC